MSLLHSNTVCWRLLPPKPKPFTAEIFPPPHEGVNSLESYTGLLDSEREEKSDRKPSVTYFEI